MEDFASARASEQHQVSGLHSEWLDQMPRGGSAKLELVSLASEQNINKPGKDVADRLDKELQEFAQSKLANPSANMQEFQKVVDKFNNNPDKQQAVYDFGSAASKIKVDMVKEAGATARALEEEGAKQPHRKELQANYESKLTNFFDNVSSLSPGEQSRVMNLLQFRPGETQEERNNRVRAGINNEGLLKSFNSMESARDKITKSESATEVQLHEQHSKQLEEIHKVQRVIDKVAIRAQI